MSSGPIFSASPAEVTPSASATATVTPSSVTSRLLDGRGWMAVCVAMDAAFLALAMTAALQGPFALVGRGDPRLLIAFPALVVVVLALRGTYGSKLQTEILKNLGHVVVATSLAALSLLATAALVGQSDESAPLLARAFVFATAFVPASIPSWRWSSEGLAALTSSESRR